MSNRRIAPWLALLLAAPAAAWCQDAARGRQVFEQCAACHTVDAASGPDGPSLRGVIGRRAGGLEDFRYSRPMVRAGLVWDDDLLERYLAEPQAVVAGTRMAFSGLPEKPDRLDVIAFLKTLK